MTTPVMCSAQVYGCEWENSYRSSSDGSFEYENYKHTVYHAEGNPPVVYLKDVPDYWE